MSAFETALEELVKHLDLVALVLQAVKGGVSKETLMKTIKAEMVNASDAVMKSELGG